MPDSEKGEDQPAIHPKSRVEFSSMMLDGYIDAEISAHHNEKWFKELKQDA